MAFRSDDSFIVAEVGIKVYPPTMIRVDYVKNVPGSDAILLHLAGPVQDSRLVRPIQVCTHLSLDFIHEIFVWLV